jgi:hypothetical protein
VLLRGQGAASSPGLATQLHDPTHVRMNQCPTARQSYLIHKHNVCTATAPHASPDRAQHADYYSVSQNRRSVRRQTWRTKQMGTKPGDHYHTKLRSSACYGYITSLLLRNHRVHLGMAPLTATCPVEPPASATTEQYGQLSLSSGYSCDYKILKTPTQQAWRWKTHANIRWNTAKGQARRYPTDHGIITFSTDTL